LAILKADISLPSVKLGDSDELIEGEKLVSITSPGGAKNMIDECLFSGNAADNHFSVSESAIAPGSSGGGVFNYNSEVIGMAVTSGYENAGLIPINNIKPILKNIK
jgi:S1-C subfamily serine protease